MNADNNVLQYVRGLGCVVGVGVASVVLYSLLRQKGLLFVAVTVYWK
jgi:hypothetical protein